MNYLGSHRKLLGNAKSAILAAVEIYNKPIFQYRDECFIILLLNAWELLLKAILSKNKCSVFYQKKRNEPYRTLSWHDALGRAEKLFPSAIHSLPVRKNLELLGIYRDNAVHFYNAKGFSVLFYALAQTSILNFRDIMNGIFNEKLEDEMTWQILPIGIKPPIDPVLYIKGVGGGTNDKKLAAVRQFVSMFTEAVKEVSDAHLDAGRLLTVFQVKLESIKKIDSADVIVGVVNVAEKEGPLTFIKTQDPNITHPLRQKDIINKIGTLFGERFTNFTFQAIAWEYQIKNERKYCWRAREGVLTYYTNDVMGFFQRLKLNDINNAKSNYRKFLQSRLKLKKNDSKRV